jgi:hypothetical protein
MSFAIYGAKKLKKVKVSTLKKESGEHENRKLLELSSDVLFGPVALPFLSLLFIGRERFRKKEKKTAVIRW